MRQRDPHRHPEGLRVNVGPLSSDSALAIAQAFLLRRIPVCSRVRLSHSHCTTPPSLSLSPFDLSEHSCISLIARAPLFRCPPSPSLPLFPSPHPLHPSFLPSPEIGCSLPFSDKLLRFPPSLPLQARSKLDPPNKKPLGNSMFIRKYQVRPGHTQPQSPVDKGMQGSPNRLALPVPMPQSFPCTRPLATPLLPLPVCPAFHIFFPFLRPLFPLGCHGAENRGPHHRLGAAPSR